MAKAAERVRVSLVPVVLDHEDQLAAAFDTILRERADGLIVESNGINNRRRTRIITFATANRIPAVGSATLGADGALLGYGPNTPENFRRAATFVDRILKGAKAGDLPIELPTKLDLMLNKRTAKTLGLTIPPSLLLRADQVIE